MKITVSTLTLQTGARGVALSRNGKRLGMLYVLPGSLDRTALAEFAHTTAVHWAQDCWPCRGVVTLWEIIETVDACGRTTYMQGALRNVEI